MTDFKKLNDQELEELRVNVREEQLGRSARARIENDIIKTLEEFTNAGGDVQNVFDKFTAEPPADESATDEDHEDVENIFENEQTEDAPVKFTETAPPVLEDAETNE